ncbi:MAG: MarC family protein [Alloalcanivorax xenomutans]|jgi:multiple antibiotic resistance protein
MIEHAITVFLAFFAIMNPIANTAVFAGLTGDKSKAEQRHIATKALRITGGILVFLVGYHMLQGSNSKLHTEQDDGDSDIAVSPLAVPLLAGPGTIATAMNYSASGGWTAIIVTCLVFLALCLITFICFLFSARIIAVIGQNGLSIVTRLMGLILAVIGTQMLIAGIQGAVHFTSAS